MFLNVIFHWAQFVIVACSYSICLISSLSEWVCFFKITFNFPFPFIWLCAEQQESITPYTVQTVLWMFLPCHFDACIPRVKHLWRKVNGEAQIKSSTAGTSRTDKDLNPLLLRGKNNTGLFYTTGLKGLVFQKGGTLWSQRFFVAHVTVLKLNNNTKIFW